jgi:pimeloyl-ACP methyl ester carboxylesterase
MARDAIAVLDATGTDRAHLIGLSFGGMVAQEVAILQPRRVASLTLMSTSPDPTDPTLPEPRVGRLALLAIRNLPLLKYRLRGDPRSLVKERIAKIISVTGPEGVDVEENAALVLYDLRERKGLNLRALRQHQAAVAATRPRAASLAKLAVPTLVVHGTEDDLIPFEHALRLAASIPDATHLWLDGVGHVFPYPASADVEGAILSHLESSARDRGTDVGAPQ